MRKTIKILIVLLAIFLSNSYVLAEDCGNYTYYNMNGEINSVFNSGTVIVENNNCKLSYKMVNSSITLNAKIKNCNQCPMEIYEYCGSGDCSTAVYKIEKRSNAIGYWGKNISSENNAVDPPVIPGKENDKYSNIETCTDVDVNHIKACGCIPAEVADITSKVYFVLRLIGPILLLIIGGFEMAKAVASQDESSIEKAKKKLVNKFIAAAAIFLVLTIIKLGVSLVADDSDSMFKCINILLDGYVI